MIGNRNKKYIRKLIKENKLEVALKSLENEFSQHEERKYVIHLLRRHKQLQNNKIKGLLTLEDANIEASKISESILNLLNGRYNVEEINRTSFGAENIKLILPISIVLTVGFLITLHINGKTSPNIQTVLSEELNEFCELFETKSHDDFIYHINKLEKTIKGIKKSSTLDNALKSKMENTKECLWDIIEIIANRNHTGLVTSRDYIQETIYLKNKEILEKSCGLVLELCTFTVCTATEIDLATNIPK